MEYLQHLSFWDWLAFGTVLLILEVFGAGGYLLRGERARAAPAGGGVAPGAASRTAPPRACRAAGAAALL